MPFDFCPGSPKTQNLEKFSFKHKYYGKVSIIDNFFYNRHINRVEAKKLNQPIPKKQLIIGDYTLSKEDFEFIIIRFSLKELLLFFQQLGFYHVNIIDMSCRYDIETDVYGVVPNKSDFNDRLPPNEGLRRQLSFIEKEKGQNFLKTNKIGGNKNTKRFKRSKKSKRFKRSKKSKRSKRSKNKI
jgi:hypothetical protein